MWNAQWRKVSTLSVGKLARSRNNEPDNYFQQSVDAFSIARMIGINFSNHIKNRDKISIIVEGNKDALMKIYIAFYYNRTRVAA